VKIVPAKMENADKFSTTSISTRPTMERYTKPAGLNASMWATSPVSKTKPIGLNASKWATSPVSAISPIHTALAITTPTKTNLGDTPLTTNQIKPARINAPIWATSPVSTTSPTSTALTTTLPSNSNLDDTPFTTTQVPAGPPSELVRIRRATPQTLPEAVEAMRLDRQRKFPISQQPSKVFDGSSIKKTSIDSSTPVSPPAPQIKTTGTGSGSRNTDSTGDDFELVEHDELQEYFDVVEEQGPSVTNGANY
jgi:hypothetical protein